MGNYYIQLFDATLANWVGEQPGVCTLARTCGHAGVMEFNGDLYACDHFVFPEYKLGNIYTQTLTEMMYSQNQLKFGADKYDKLPMQCKECEFLFACNGECPKNRFLHTASGELYGFYEKRIIGPASARKRDAMGKREQRDFIKQYEIQQT